MLTRIRLSCDAAPRSSGTAVIRPTSARRGSSLTFREFPASATSASAVRPAGRFRPRAFDEILSLSVRRSKPTAPLIRSFRYSESGNTLVDTLQASSRLSQAGGLEPLYQALMLNHIQGMLIEPFDYPTLGEKKIRDITTIIAFNDPPVPHGLIMSKKAVSPTEQEKWRALVDAMRADGTTRRIFEKYFDPDLAATLVNF